MSHPSFRVKNFAGCLVVRLLIGAAEAGFAVTIIWYLTTFYTYAFLVISLVRI